MAALCFSSTPIELALGSIFDLIFSFHAKLQFRLLDGDMCCVLSGETE